MVTRNHSSVFHSIQLIFIVERERGARSQRGFISRTRLRNFTDRPKNVAMTAEIETLSAPVACPSSTEIHISSNMSHACSNWGRAEKMLNPRDLVSFAQFPVNEARHLLSLYAVHTVNAYLFPSFRRISTYQKL